MALLQDVVLNVPSTYSNMDLSHRNRLTCKSGLLYPIETMEVLPGDTITIVPDVRVNTAPMVAPLDSSHDISVDYFFVPTRLYVQSMDTNRLTFTPEDIQYPVATPLTTVRYKELYAIQGNVNGVQYGTFYALSGLQDIFASQITGSYGDINLVFQNFSLTSASAAYDFKAAFVDQSEATQRLPEVFESAAVRALTYSNIRFQRNSLIALMDAQGSRELYSIMADTGSSKPMGVDFYYSMTTPLFPTASSTYPTYMQELKKNAIPLVGYYDIFRNYYANTQEKWFWMNSISIPIGAFNSNDVSLRNSSMELSGPGLLAPYNYDSIQGLFHTTKDSDTGLYHVSFDQNNMNRQFNTYCRVPLADLDDFIMEFVKGETSFEKAWYNTLGSYSQSKYLDVAPNTMFTPFDACPFAPTSLVPIDPFFLPYTVNRPDIYGIYPAHGLCARTFAPDFNTVWLSSDTYGQMLQSSAMNTQNDQLTIQQIRTASHLLDYDERGILAGGRYDDWVYSQFGRRNSHNLCIPQYLGRYKSRIVSMTENTTAASVDDPAGSFYGRGVGYIEPNKPIKFSSNEHGYIIGILSINPNASYSDGHNMLFDKTEFGDIYAPSLARIGFQSRSIYDAYGANIANVESGSSPVSGYSRRVTVSVLSNSVSTTSTGSAATKNNYSLGYLPAWTEYMTNVDKVHGDFVPGQPLDQWVLTRDISLRQPVGFYSSGVGVFDSALYTSYVMPFQYSYPFADQDPDLDNFYVMISSNVHARRRLSKNPMPTIA